MAKVSGAYDSVVRGVSEQVPQDRLSGQHAEQVNMVSDPVKGLARRHGSIMIKEQVHSAYSDSVFAKLLEDTKTHRVLPFSVAGVEYDLIYRANADTQGLGQNGFAWCFNKTDKVFVPIVFAPGDPVLANLIAGGVSSALNVGKYLLLAGKTIQPKYTAVDTFGSASNLRYMAVWVRGPAFARKFSITVSRGSLAPITVSYTTPAASYPTLLDTSAIPVNSTTSGGVNDYQKRVNDAVNAWNSAATAWIGTSAAASAPKAIAAALAAALTAAGVAGANTVGSTVIIDDPTCTDVSASDDGDGSLIRAVGAEVSAPDLVSPVHRPGKIVRVRPKKASADDRYYLKAVIKSATAGGTS